MVQPYDIRIGNLLLWNPKLVNPLVTLPPFPVTVASIFNNKIGYLSPSMQHRVEPFEDDLLQLDTPVKSLEEFEPILLTAAILQLAGFKESSSAWIHSNANSIELYKSKAGEGFGTGKGNNNYLVTFVHQLQNFYYALTGEDIEISLF